MKIGKSNILVGFIVMLCIAFTVYEFIEEYFLSQLCKALIVPFFTILYFVNVKRRSLLFTCFLMLFSISELLIFTELFIDFDSMTEEGFLKYNNVYYMIGNLLYISAYIFFLLDVLKTLDVRMVFKNYKIHLVVLSALNVYIIYVLLTIVNPYVDGSYMFFVELIYNIVMLLLLTSSLISYFYNDNKKSLLLFIGAVCIVFSEVIQVAYYYILNKDLFNLLQTLLFVVAFSFFYFQSKIKNKRVQFFA